jgi:hypothetical protein
MSDRQPDSAQHRDIQSPGEPLSSSSSSKADLNEMELSTIWNREIADHIRQLRAVMQTSEDGFLSVGSKLREIHLSARNVSQKLAGLVDNYSAEGETNSINKLRVMSDCSTKQLDSFNDFSLQAVAHLQNLESPLASLPESLHEFDRLVSRLRKMGTVAHIEAARIGDEGLDFIRLAETVSVLGEKITAKAREVRTYIKGASEVIALNKGKMEQVIGKHKNITKLVTNDMKSNLQVLDEKHELYQKITSGISDKSEDALRNVHVVVQSVQYHDITRQQVDHIIEALQSIQQQNSVFEAVPICQIQVAQLRRVGLEFEDAVLSIVTALGQLSNAVTTMLSESEQMTNFTKDSGTTFFEYVERGVETVSATMMKDWYAVQELISSLEQISENIRKMKSFMDEMANVGSEIELLALNSRVKAARTGSSGAALAVIAESIQHLSLVALDQVDGVVKQMSHMVTVSGDLTNNHTIETVTHRAEIETKNIIEKLRDAIQVFHSDNAMTIKIFLETESICKAMVGQLESLSKEIGRHREIALSLIKTGDMLEQLAVRTRASVPDSARAIIDERLEEMRKRYTMETERETHNAVLSGNQTQAGMPSGGGSNIELF